jgi:teichoic acid transport system ATP-binding protein
MAHHSPARWLAPLALVAFLLALVVVLGASGGDGTDEVAAPAGKTSTATPTAKKKSSSAKKSKAKSTYVVKLGDTPSAIAAQAGLSLEELERLNPDLDAQLLQPGDEIRVR